MKIQSKREIEYLGRYIIHFWDEKNDDKSSNMPFNRPAMHSWNTQSS